VGEVKKSLFIYNPHLNEFFFSNVIHNLPMHSEPETMRARMIAAFEIIIILKMTNSL
jgi:hypothetical protein